MKAAIGGVSAVILVVLLVIFWPLTTVGAGERGIVLTWGAYNGQVMQPGLNLRTPIAQRVVKFDVQTQKGETDASAASRDLQTVTAKVAINFHVQPEKVGDLYQRIGLDYADRIIAPAIQEAVKATTAKFTAEELITKRQQVKEEARTILSARLSKDFIVVDDFSIVNFDFSQSFNQAIEAKVTAEQNALAAKNKLEQVKFEAQQQIETAKAQAESIRIQAQALAQNQELVKLKAVEKWDGKLPTYMLNNVTPFLDIQK
jgi:regulator of protease activity HflC (stomatin/prohibitin superfamily)